MLFVQLTTCSQYALDTNEVCLENSQGTCECTSEPPKLPCLRLCAATIECPNETMDVRRSDLTVCSTKSPLSYNVSTRPFGCTETFNYSSSNPPSTCKRCLQMVSCSPCPGSILMTSSANQTITCRAEDNCRRIESCTFHINIDGEAPTLDCPNLNFQANIGQSSININGFRDCNLTDNCDVVPDLNITCEGEENNGELRRDLDFTGPNTFSVNTTTRVNCTATDLSGNSARNTFLVNVTGANDTTTLHLDCENVQVNYTQEGDTDQCFAAVNFSCALSTNSESNPNITCINDENNDKLDYTGQNMFILGATNVTCTATVGSELASSKFTVDVQVNGESIGNNTPCTTSDTTTPLQDLTTMKNIDVYVTDVTIFVGSIVAIIFILATMITAQSVHSTQGRRILVQTCLALLGLHLAFLIGIQRRFSEAACIVFGVLVHFFALSSKSWITVESISIYIQATGKPSQDISHFVLKAAAGAWGFPAIICVVTAVVDRTLHLDDNTYCFFALSTGLYYSVVLFLIALLVLDIIMWAMTAWCLCDKPDRGMDPDSKDGANSPVPGKADEGGAARRLKNVMAITPLLCASFFLGFRSFSSPSTIVNILFLVFTDVFGLLLFVLHCVSQAEVRDHWSRCMRCNYAKLHVRIRRRTQRKPYDTSRGLDRPSDRMTMIEMADEADGKADLHGEASNGGLDATDGPDAMEADETSNGKLPTKTTAPDETNPDTSAVDQPGDSKDSSLVSQDKTEKTTEVEGNPDSGKPLLV